MMQKMSRFDAYGNSDMITSLVEILVRFFIKCAIKGATL